MMAERASSLLGGGGGASGVSQCKKWNGVETAFCFFKYVDLDGLEGGHGTGGVWVRQGAARGTGPAGMYGAPGVEKEREERRRG